MSTPDHNALVVKSNALVPSLAQLDLMELRLLAFCISHIEAKDSHFEPIIAKAKDFANIFDIPEEKAYSLVKSLVKRVNTKPAEYEEGDDDVTSFWFTTFRYGKRGSGDFTFKFNPDLKTYLLGLQDNFTAYRIKDVYQFKMATTWHLYELLRQYKNIGKIELYLDKFKTLVGLSGKYKRFNSLKFDFLTPALADINKVSDIKVQYELMKEGVKVSGIRFFIRKNDATMTRLEKINEDRKQSSVQPQYDVELSKLLRNEYKIAPQQAKQLANLIDYHNCKEKAFKLLPTLKGRYDKLQDKKTSLGGYVFRALRDELTQGSLAGD